MNRVAYLDGIRAMAIAGVLAVHWIASQFPAVYGGYIGVDIFFVLSGYIITSMLWRKRSADPIPRQYGRFLWRRVVRLYPALTVFVVVTLVIYAVFPGAPMSPSDLAFPALVALGQGYSIYAGSGAAEATPFAITWSLSVEWMFYVLWPLAIFAARRRGLEARRVARWSAAIAVVLYLVALFQDSHWFYYGPLARVPEIMVGGVLALLIHASAAQAGRAARSGLSPKVLPALAILSIAFIGLYTLFGPVQWSPVFRFVGLPLTVAATAYLIWFGQRLPDSRLTALLGWGPAAFLGRISYSLYLWHMVGLNLFTRDNMGDLPLLVVAGLSVGLAVCLAGLSYRFLERPFLRSRASVLRDGSKGPVPSLTKS